MSATKREDATMAAAPPFRSGDYITEAAAAASEHAGVIRAAALLLAAAVQCSSRISDCSLWPCAIPQSAFIAELKSVSFSATLLPVDCCCTWRAGQDGSVAALQQRRHMGTYESLPPIISTQVRSAVRLEKCGVWKHSWQTAAIFCTLSASGMSAAMEPNSLWGVRCST